MIHRLAGSTMPLLIARSCFALICVTAMAYYALAIHAARKFFGGPKRPAGGPHPPITVLKPVHGLDRDAYENFASFCRQRYAKYQVIFGADAEDDPGIAVARQVARNFPHVDVRIVISGELSGANPKVGSLARMAAEAKYSLLLVSDSDIRVGPSHLETMVGPMEDPRVGVVTCLYRSEALGLAGTLDALGLSTDFQPSVLVAREIEGVSFAMGSGALIRRSALDAAGGFEAIADYLADDYFLGHLPTQAGYRVDLRPHVVDHRLDTAGFGDLAAHQIRWNRGIRAARPGGYAGLLFIQGVPAALSLGLLTHPGSWLWGLAALTIALRMTMAWFVGVRCLEDPAARRALWLVPVRDLLGFGLWFVSFFGSTVVWRGSRFRLGKGGRLLRAPAPAALAPVARTRIAS